MPKTTIQDIADALDISRVTIWKVFSGREGVSEDLKTKIIAKAREMNYSLPKSLYQEEIKPQIKEQYTVSVTVSRPETSSFWITILHEVAKEMARYNINLLYTYLPSEPSPDYELPSVLTNGTVNGIIVLNIYDEALIKMLAKLSTPKVFMDTSTAIPFNELHGDLILIEGKSGISEIVESIIKKGRTEIGFIGDANYAQTNYERYRGFIHAMEENNVPVNPSYCLTGPIGIHTYAEEINEFIDGLPKMPEAFICVSDFVANLLCQSLLDRKYKVPQDVAISGFDGNTDFPHSAELTTVQVHNDCLGLRLAYQIIYRMQHPDACYEYSYLCSDVVYRNSTNF